MYIEKKNVYFIFFICLFLVICKKMVDLDISAGYLKTTVQKLWKTKGANISSVAVNVCM